MLYTNMNEHQQNLKKYKTQVFAGQRLSNEELTAAGINPDVSTGWVETARLGIDPGMSSLPKDSNDRTVLDRLPDITKLDWSLGETSYQSIGSLLEVLGAAVYFLDDHLAIYNYIGDPNLIALMKARGLKFGYRLSENYIGVYPPNITSKTGRASLMVGEEHPLSTFSDFVSFSVVDPTPAGVQPREFNFSLSENRYISLLVMPLEKYSEDNFRIVEFILRNMIPNCSLQWTAASLARIFSLSEEVNSVPTMYVSNEYKILYVNRSLEEEMRLAYEDCIGTDVGERFPQLAFLKEVMTNQTRLKFLETKIDVDGVSRNYYIENSFLRQDGSTYAMKVAVSTQGNIDYYKKNLNVSGNSAIFTFESIIGSSASLTDTKRMARRAANSDSNVLITGESGTGKELFSQAMHNESGRRQGPFIPINCGSIPKELIGSELFGYEPGAFTGAKKSGHIGKFELADKGTLFLDEIAEMPLDMQSNLLRVLEDGVVYRLGSTKPQTVNVRIIAATNRDLWAYVNEGRFRLDLYFRLSVIKLNIPPLRERTNDVEELANYYIHKFSDDLGRRIDGIEDKALNVLKAYSWPGNVRELRNAMECASNLMLGTSIMCEDLPADIIERIEDDLRGFAPANNSVEKQPGRPELDDGQTYADYERQQIRHLMLKHKGNKSKVALEVGIARNTLAKRLKEMGY